MKRLFAVFTLLTVVLGAISGAALQSFGVGLIATAAFSPEVGFYSALTTFVLSFILPKSDANYACVAFLEGICEDIQQSLVETLGSNAPSLKRTNVGSIEALVSGTNTAGTTKVQIDQGNGKERRVRFTYIQRGTADDIGTTRPTSCAGQVEPAPKESFLSITNEKYTKVMTFTEANMRKLCTSGKEYMASVMNSRIDPLIVELNKDVIADIAANFGNFYGGVGNARKDVELLNSNGTPKYLGEAQILDDIEDLESAVRPIVIGAGKLRTYIRQIGIGCCNDGGQNLAEAGDLDYYSDKYVGGELGNPDDFIAMIPGHVQFLTFNENMGEHAIENETFSHTTIRDPKTGIVLDMDWYYDTCQRVYTLFFGVRWEMFYLPANAFSYGDELSGFNGLLHYRAKQAA